MKTNFDELSEMEGELRLPLKPIGWTVAAAKIALRRPVRCGDEKSFVSGIFPDNTQRLFEALRLLLDSRAADFEIAAVAIKPEAWRLLFYRHVYVAEALAAFRFHPEQALREIACLGDDFNDPPQSWIGSDRSISDITEELEITLREIGYGPSSAAWFVLSVAQAIALTRTEVRLCSFWDREYLKHLVERVRLID